MSSTYLSGFGYYITFIHDYSRNTWIYFLKAKNEVFDKFKEFKALIENISDKITKLDPSGKKGIFVGYYEVSKAFRIYILGFHHIEISRDVTFDEEATLKRSRKSQHEEVYEEEASPRNKEATCLSEDETPE